MARRVFCANDTCVNYLEEYEVTLTLRPGESVKCGVCCAVTAVIAE